MQQPINGFPGKSHTTSTTIMPFLGNEVHLPHLLAQKLNNRASFFIATCNYEEGIVLLTKALQLIERNISVNKEKQSCSCKFCRLEACLIMEHDMEHDSFSIHTSFDDDDCDGMEFDNDGCGHLIHRQAQDQAPKDTPTTFEKDYGFVYHRPLLVNKHCIEEGHIMGMTLSLIIVFNLALAHHLKAISTIDTKPNTGCSPSNKNLQVLHQALQLYELAYQLHTDYVQQPLPSSGALSDEHNRSIGSLRLTMIISNNLGQIHRVAGNSTKHKMCLHHLLSAIMYMVDCKFVVLDSTEMYGFYHNVSPIMLTDICAEAA